VALKVLSIGQREELLRQGLTDRNQGVQKVVEKELGKVLENILEWDSITHQMLAPFPGLSWRVLFTLDIFEQNKLR